MTDLEELWEDLPIGTPPVDASCEGRGSSPHRKIIRPFIAVDATPPWWGIPGRHTVGDGPRSW